MNMYKYDMQQKTTFIVGYENEIVSTENMVFGRFIYGSIE